MSNLSKQFLLTMLLALLSCATMSAHDFEVANADGVTIYYKKLTGNTCAVSYRGSSYDSYSDRYTGHVAIPSSVAYNGITYSVKSIANYAFSGCKGLQSVEIPNSITAIGDRAFMYCSFLVSIEIPISVTAIGYYAFADCLGLKVVFNHSSLNITQGSEDYGYVGYYAKVITDTASEDGLYYADDAKTQLIAFDGKHQSVVIPNSVMSIGNRAFSYCSGLQSVNIPNSVTNIGDYTFYFCSGLQSVNIPNSVTKIGGHVFSFCSGLQSVNIPNSVTSIGKDAFYRCSALRSVTIGTGVLSVGTNAFYDCTSLCKLTLLPNTVPTGLADALPSVPSEGRITYVANDNYSGSRYGTIKEYDYLSSMFEVDGIVYVPVSPAERTCAAIESSYSSAAKDVSIDKTVKYKGVELKVVEINPYVLIGNSNVESVKISAEADVQKYFASYCGNIKTIELTNNGTVGEYAFRNCAGLQTLTVSNSVTDIGYSAFRESMTNSNNAQAVLNNVGPIGWSAFYGCSKLQTASLAETINAIGSGAFCNCTNLQNINIPSAVTTIEDNTFNGCSSLHNIVLPDGLTAIKDKAFASSGLTSIIIPAAMTSIGDGVFNGCTSLARFDAKDGAEQLKMGYNYNSKGLFADCPLKEIVIGRNLVYNISSGYGYSPFYRNTALEKVTFTDVPTEVFTNEFYGCTSLKEVSLGDGVKKIGDYAFSGCSAIETFSFGASLQSIGNEAFSDCTNMTKLYAEPSTPPTCGTQALDDINKWECTLYVANGAKDSYQSAPQWKEFFFLEGYDFTGGNVVPGGSTETKQCATPSIAYADGEVSFSCGTPGAECHYTIASNLFESGTTSGGVSVAPSMTVTAYATAEGYTQSETATATFDLAGGYKEVIKEVEKEVIVYVYDSSEATDIALETGETIKLYLSKGKAMIVDAPMGSTISVYSNTGAMVKTLTVNDVATTIELPTDNIYIIKVGTKVFKVKV